VESIEAMVGSAGFNTDPYPTYDRLLAERVWVTPWGGKVYGRYEDCSAILRDPATFAQGLQNLEDPPFIQLDPPDHTRLRKLVLKAFGPAAIRRLAPQIDALVASLLEPVRESGSMELISSLAHPLPAGVITSMLGMPMEDEPLWSGWQDTIVDSTAAPRFLVEQMAEAAERDAAAAQAGLEQAEYFSRLVEERRRQPGRQDILSDLIRAEEDGDRLTRKEVLATVLLLLVAGYHTTINLIANGTLALLRHPDQLKLLRDEPSLLPDAIEEMLRFDGPVQMATPRLVKQECELGGLELRVGELVLPIIAAANRDPSMFKDPHFFDIRRPDANRHLGFGFGIHHCLGAALARAEGAAAFRYLVNLPDLQLAGDPLDYGGRYGFHGPKAVRITWSS
jgi:cytochrome P450